MALTVYTYTRSQSVVSHWYNVQELYVKPPIQRLGIPVSNSKLKYFIKKLLESNILRISNKDNLSTRAVVVKAAA